MDISLRCMVPCILIPFYNTYFEQKPARWKEVRHQTTEGWSAPANWVQLVAVFRSLSRSSNECINMWQLARHRRYCTSCQACLRKLHESSFSFWILQPLLPCVWGPVRGSAWCLARPGEEACLAVVASASHLVEGVAVAFLKHSRMLASLFGTRGVFHLKFLNHDANSHRSLNTANRNHENKKFLWQSFFFGGGGGGGGGGMESYLILWSVMFVTKNIGPSVYCLSAHFPRFRLCTCT